MFPATSIADPPMSFVPLEDDQETLHEALALLEGFDPEDDLFAAATASVIAAPSFPDPLAASPTFPPQSVLLAPKPPSLFVPVSAPAKVPLPPFPRAVSNESTNDDEENGEEDDAVKAISASMPGQEGRASADGRGNSTTSTGVVGAEKKGSKRVRKRQKDELIYLRCRVNELEDRLERLQKKSRVVPPSPALTNMSSTSSSGLSSTTNGEEENINPLQAPSISSGEKPSAQLASVWEKVAARQYEQRQQAEIENVKLKEMLEEQIRVARSLEKLLYKRANGNLLQANKGNKRFKWNRVATKEEEAAMFAEMLEGLEEQYRQSDQIFTFDRFAKRGAIFRDIQVRMRDEEVAEGDGGEDVEGKAPGIAPGEMYIDVLDSKILPFELSLTAEAFWQHLSNGESTMNTLFRETRELTNDTMARSFGVEIKAGPMQGEFRGKQCVRRYQESEDRVVIVWSMLAEPIELSGMFMGGLLVKQRSWIELTRSKEDPTQATQLRARYIMSPDVYDDDAPDQVRKVGAITDFVIHSTHGNLNSSHQMIENILIQSSLKRKDQ